MKYQLIFLVDQDGVFNIELDNPPMPIQVGDFFDSKAWGKHEMEVCGSPSRVTAIEHYIPKDEQKHTVRIHLKPASEDEYDKATMK